MTALEGGRTYTVRFHAWSVWILRFLSRVFYKLGLTYCFLSLVPPFLYSCIFLFKMFIYKKGSIKTLFAIIFWPLHNLLDQIKLYSFFISPSIYNSPNVHTQGLPSSELQCHELACKFWRGTNLICNG